MKARFLSIGLLIILACFATAPFALAAGTGYLENDGKMDLKTDRLQKTNEEKQEDLKKAEPTMLDQLELPLFTQDLEKKNKSTTKERTEKIFRRCRINCLQGKQ
ncbi:type VII secretion protein EssA [Listeria aquatica]|uniref:Uncharacterized protein n=1 Tax=Listeria aquatica FSL S10-1188 TaxID=1265818 RepID=W7B2M1_9LIST|nr:type VII secretion protein EssA [Listeria aquatica]EUJ16951.1 hypothetical protein MAQA_14429 [Listeria aquatica FSL S10-1188]